LKEVVEKELGKEEKISNLKKIEEGQLGVIEKQEQVWSIQQTEERLDPESQSNIMKKAEEQISVLQKQIDFENEKALTNASQKVDTSVSLRHKLNLTLNPMYENIIPVIEKSFANTKNFDDYIVKEVEEDVDPSQLQGLKKLSFSQNKIKQVEQVLDELFQNLPSSAISIPQDVNNQVKDSLIILDNSKAFCNAFEVSRDGVLEDLSTIVDLFKDSYETVEEVMQFFNLSKEYEEMQNASKNSIDIQVL
jgi:hypothetical protein